MITLFFLKLKEHIKYKNTIKSSQTNEFIHSKIGLTFHDQTKIKNTKMTHCLIENSFNSRGGGPISPVALTIMVKFTQTSSRQNRERSFSTSSFSKERIVPPKSFFVRGDQFPVNKTGQSCQFPNRLLSCVKVHLGW